MINQTTAATTDTNAQRHARQVPIAGSQRRHAAIDPADWQNLKGSVQGRRFFLLTLPERIGQPGPVSVQCWALDGQHTMFSPAAWLLDAGPRDRVVYRDGNPLNLRRSNLALELAEGVTLV